jgi:hypothetical protein
MKLRTVCSALIIGGLVTAFHATPSLAQSGGPAVPAPKEAAKPAPNAKPNRNTNPTKHRHWRHRGGSHPHYGSRRIRT